MKGLGIGSIPFANWNEYDGTCLKTGEVVISKDGWEVISTPPTSDNIRILKMKIHDTRNLFSEVYQGAEEVLYAHSAAVEKVFDYQNFHNKMGHPGPKKMIELLKIHHPELQSVGELKLTCDACKFGKMVKRTIEISGTVYPLLGLIHTDICGPISVSTLGGRKYILNFMDDTSKFCVSALLETKDGASVAKVFAEFIAHAERITGKKVLKLRSDQGTEFLNDTMRCLLSSLGIVHEVSNAYTPKQNGNAERLNLTLWQMIRTLMLDSKLPSELWGDIHMQVVHLYNHRPHSSLNNRTPAQAFYPEDDSRRNLKKEFLHEIGTCMMIPTVSGHRNKMGSRAIKGFYVGVGCNQPGARVWIPERNLVLTSAAAVKHSDEKYTPPANAVILPLVLSEEREYQVQCILDEKTVKGKTYYLVRWQGYEASDDTWESHDNIKNCEALDRWESTEYSAYTMALNTFVPETPKNVVEALKSSASALWWEAMQAEYNAILSQDTFEVVPRPKDRKVVGSTWVLRVKNGIGNEAPIYKARLCARGFTQIPGLDYDETFAPTVSRTGLRLVIAIAMECDMLLHVVDCKNAFLNGKIDKEIYMEQPELMYSKGTCRKSHVWKLKKALYGLKQSPLIWNSELHRALEKIGFTQMRAEPCIYILNQGKNSFNKVHESFIILAVYVDDILIAAASQKALSFAKSSIANIFKIKDEGEARKIIGIELTRQRHGLILHQSEYIEDIIERFNFKNCNPVTIPMDIGNKLVHRKEHERIVTDAEYRQKIGALLFAATCTRPDICIPVNICSRYVNEPTQDHVSSVTKIFRYLKYTPRLGIRYTKDQKNLHLVCFSDADYSNDSSDSKSTSGYVVSLNGKPISWKASKQTLVTTSTVEAEYIAACAACKEVMWLRYLVEEIMGQPLSAAPDLFIDNTGALTVSTNNVLTNKTKHIRCKFHFISDCAKEKVVNLRQVSTHENPADMLTKPLARVKLQKFSKMLKMESVDEVNTEKV